MWGWGCWACGCAVGVSRGSQMIMACCYRRASREPLKMQPAGVWLVHTRCQVVSVKDHLVHISGSSCSCVRAPHPRLRGL